MKKTILFFALAVLCQWASAIKIVSGPYLQNMTDTSCDIMWRTDKPSTAWVELAPDDGTHFYFKERPRTYSTDLGRAVVGTLHRVTLRGLKPGTSYRYRVYSEEVLDQQPYHVDFGGVAAQDVFRAEPPKFTTLSADKPTLEFLVLDAGEDKPDSDIEYSGTSFFDDYRRDEAQWLAETLESEECRQAPFKIVVMHVPLAWGTWHGQVNAKERFLPLLNKAGIDLMLCGHIHSYAYYPEGTDGANFPVLQNSNDESARIKVDSKAMDIKVLNRKGDVLHTFHYDK